MFSSLTDPIKITVSIVVGMVIAWAVTTFTYEGLRLPLVGQVVNGRMADAVSAAKATMVTTFERDALQAQLDRERRDRHIAEAASARAQERAAATELDRQATETRLKQLQAQAMKDGLQGWSKEELEWYDKH